MEEESALSPASCLSSSPFINKSIRLWEERHGDITSPEFCSPETALVQIINCVAVRPHGLSQTLASSYPYSNSYAYRRPVGKLNRAVESDRPKPGSIMICRPSSQLACPIVVNVCGQFYMGKAVEKNVYSNRLIDNIEAGRVYPDHHLLQGLRLDTAENRIKWFQKGLQNLTDTLSLDMTPKVSRVVFPSRIGCGQAGGEWGKDYLPAIARFSSQIQKLGVNVIIVKLGQGG